MEIFCEWEQHNYSSRQSLHSIRVPQSLSERHFASKMWVLSCQETIDHQNFTFHEMREANIIKTS